MLYSRDLVRFYELQRDHYSRRGLLMRFGMALGYYVSTFNLFLWGLLDHLTIVAKYARGLGVEERRCSIRSDAFWNEFGLQEPGLRAFVKGGEIGKWIDMMADMRHAAAHRAIPMPTVILYETEESKKSDEEIRETLRMKRPFFYAFPTEMIEALEPSMIWHWRVRHMKTVSQSMVLLKGRDREYFRDPVVSTDWDLSRAAVVLDAFLVRLFGQRGPTGT